MTQDDKSMFLDINPKEEKYNRTATRDYGSDPSADTTSEKHHKPKPLSKFLKKKLPSLLLASFIGLTLGISLGLLLLSGSIDPLSHYVKQLFHYIKQR